MRKLKTEHAAHAGLSKMCYIGDTYNESVCATVFQTPTEAIMIPQYRIQCKISLHSQFSSGPVQLQFYDLNCWFQPG